MKLPKVLRLCLPKETVNVEENELLSKTNKTPIGMQVQLRKPQFYRGLVLNKLFLVRRIIHSPNFQPISSMFSRHSKWQRMGYVLLLLNSILEVLHSKALILSNL
ncbi:hypothetical protein HMI55_005471, partial [Coelomomyces lativittatus]